MAGQRSWMRLLAYASWTAAAVAVPLAIDRLLVAPALAERLGEVRFGGLMWVVGIVNWIGLGLSGGLSNQLARGWAELPPGQRPLHVRIQLRLALMIVGGGLAVVFACNGATVRSMLGEPAATVVALFAVFGALRAAASVYITVLRIERRFGQMLAVRLCESLVIVVILVWATRSPVAISWVYVASAALPLWLAWGLVRLPPSPGWRGPTARLIVAQWAGLTFAGVIDQAIVYAPRTFLGVYASGAAVAELFGATSIGAIFLLPAGQLGGLVLSLTASRREFALPGRLATVYVLVLLALSAGLSGLAWFVGPPLIRVLYAGPIADGALACFGWVVCNIAFGVFMLMLRPIVLRYGRIRQAALLGMLTLGVQYAALSAWATSGGAVGAARAMAVAGVVSAVAWLTAYVQIVRTQAGTAEGSA